VAVEGGKVGFEGGIRAGLDKVVAEVVVGEELGVGQVGIDLDPRLDIELGDIVCVVEGKVEMVDLFLSQKLHFLYRNCYY
jgi:hypothetical protein